jgi:hypothetical protein
MFSALLNKPFCALTCQPLPKNVVQLISVLLILRVLMQNLIDPKLLLKVFSIVEKQGQPATTPFGNGFELDGMQVATGFDGYDLYFLAFGVTLTLGFHQKYNIDASSEDQVDQFIEHLKSLANRS